MSSIERKMCRCVLCKRWQSIAPDAEMICGGCNAPVEQVDMKAHIAALPMREAKHNHPESGELKTRGSCEACDIGHAEIDKKKLEAARAAAKPA
jgi:hypothetical protein